MDFTRTHSELPYQPIVHWFTCNSTPPASRHNVKVYFSACVWLFQPAPPVDRDKGPKVGASSFCSQDGAFLSSVQEREDLWIDCNALEIPLNIFPCWYHFKDLQKSFFSQRIKKSWLAHNNPEHSQVTKISWNITFLFWTPVTCWVVLDFDIGI